MPTPKWESLVTLLLLAAASISSATDCPAGSTRFLHQSDAIYCYSLHGDLGIDRLNWIDAQTACRNLGANSDLVSIQDQSEQNTLMVAIQAANFGTVRFWIGYNDRAVEGSFVWTDGTPSFFTNWNAVEPSNGGGNGGGNEDCVETLNAAGEWNDVPCTLTRPHICKLVVQEPLPNITSVTSTMGDSPFRNSTTVTYECIARRDTGDEVIFWLGPDGRNASDSARITVEQTQPTSTTLNLTMVITEFQAENSGQYTCVVRNNAREANQTVNIGFQECPAGSTRFQHQNGATYCYSLHGAVNAQRLNQSEALATCRGLGANSDLVSIQDQSEQNAVLNAIQEANFNTNEFWIGYNDLAVENSFVWTDGTPSFFTNWNAGEPNNLGGNEDCVEMSSTVGVWNDQSCGSTRAHICKLVVQEPLPNITSVTSIVGDSPFLSSTTVTYECIARRDTGDEVIFWLGPDGRNASDSARITVEQTQPTSTTLNLTMVITEGRVENSGQYTCVVRNNARETNQTASIAFQVILALDGVTGNPFPIQFTEGSRELELLSFQHVALLIGQEPICSASLQLTNSGPLNDPSVERIVPTKVLDDDSGELMTSQDLIRYNKASPYSPQDLLTILRNQEYFNFANEFTVGQRTVTWTIGSCGSNVTVATGITNINLVHVNDNPPVIQLRSASVVV